MVTGKKIIFSITIIFIIFTIWAIGPKYVNASGFTYFRSVVIDHTKVGTVNNTDQSNFPVLVSLNNAILKDVAHGGHVQNSNGYDIYFYSDSALTTRIPAERESYDATNGVLVEWVKIGAVSHTTDTTIYMAYGNVGISTDPNLDGTYGKTKVWDDGGANNYKGVWHLPDGSNLNIADSTGINTSTNNGGTPALGKIGGGVNVVANSSQYVDLGSNVALKVIGPMTVEAWISTADFATYYRVALSNYLGADGYEFVMVPSSDGGNPNKIYFQAIAAGTGQVAMADSPMQANTFYHVVGTYNGSIGKIYVNGAVQSGSFSGASAIGSNGANLNIGRRANNNNYWNGGLDEVRVSNIVRSPDWIATEYNNQNNPGNIGSAGFYTVGGEQQTNLPPTVNAGADQNISLPATTTSLNGSATDSDGTVASYAWSQVSGPSTATIVSASSASTSVTALSSAGTYVFRLTATDNLGGIGTDDVNVVVNPDSIPPTIVNIFSNTANGIYKWDSVIDIQVTFSEAVNSSLVTVNLDSGGSCTFSVSNSSSGSCNYIVHAGQNSLDLNVSSISGTITDIAGNQMSNFIPTTNLAVNKDIIIDTLPIIYSGGGSIITYIPPATVLDTSHTEIPPSGSLVPAQTITPPPPILQSEVYNFGATNLKFWSKGSAVKELQKFLNKEFNLNLAVDGILGLKTITLVKKWQKMHGLVADGIVGVKTKMKMKQVF
jgi:hypothetical protein